MTVCPQCGEENPERAKFCLNCATGLRPEAAPSREARKTVTVLFCDVTGSTALGERLDPESLRVLLARYFERMKAIVERHGGTVEKFIGDAVMAVFGVPVLHEDDALRAVRAAAEMRAAFPALGVEGRIGIMTGEVVTGTEERLATGDAVNVAARLEQAAQPGEVLLGEETLRLIRGAVEVEATEPLALKGKAESVPAYRLLSVPAERPARAGPPMVGRGREQRLLADAWERVASERSCHLFTILGPAGVGKSRLAAEFLASAEDATVARGRCLSYGVGITYWPVVEVVKQLPDADLDEAAAATIGALLGEQALISSSEEIAWAFRKLLEAVATEQPLVCVFDDVHWGEETFLDLVEHVADLARDAPILLLCMARPELLDRRSGWGGGKVNATTVLLEPLAPEETELLIASLAELDESLRSRIREAAEGNPLFVEEMVAILGESADGDVVVPPTIQALLAARLDQLDPQERDVLQCGSVEGRVFHRGAVQALAPGEPHVTARLTTLVRKEFVRPDKAQLPREDAFRFRHQLICDAAYDALPKATRAELHERFAAWLEQHGRDLVELDEILGHHLEQASRYKAEIAQPDHALAGLAGGRLAAAGRRAQARGDMPAAVRLLRRAASLLGNEAPEGPDLLLALGMALAQAGELSEADAALGEAVEAATRAGSRRLEHQASIERLARRIWSGSEGSIEEQQQAIERAISIFEAEDDELGLARAHKWQAEIYNAENRADNRAQALEAALQHAQAAGDAVEENEIINYLAGALVLSSTPADKAIRRCEDLLESAAAGPVAKVTLIGSLAHLHARRGNFEHARRLISTAKETAEEFGLRWSEARLAEPAGWISLLEGDPAAAEREFSRGCELFEVMGERGRRATTTFWLAEAVYRQGRLDEAEQLARIAEELGQEEFPAVRAKVLASRGELAEAVTLARRAVELARRYQASFTYWLLDAGEVFHLAGLEHAAEEVIAEALVLYEQGGNCVMAERARERLASEADDRLGVTLRPLVDPRPLRYER